MRLTRICAGLALGIVFVLGSASPSAATTPVGPGWDAKISTDGLGLFFWTTYAHGPQLRMKRTLATLTDSAAPLPVPPGGAYTYAVNPNERYIAYVTYSSYDTNPFDTNQRQDVYVYDTVTTTNSRVSLNNSNNEGNADADLPSMSHDGRYVVFETHATNFIPGGDVNGTYPDVFVRDRCVSDGNAVPSCTPSTQLVSVGPTGNQSTNFGCQLNDFDGGQSISGDGRYVVMTCYHDLDPSHACSHNFCFGTFVRDRCISNGVAVPSCTPSTELVSLGPGGAYPNSSTTYAVISGDGSRVVYESTATDITADPEPNTVHYGVFMYDRNTQTSQRLSTPPPDDDVLAANTGPTISGDGRRVTWQFSPNSNYYDETITLWADCAALQPTCGDGFIERGCEECDDSNVVDGDGCDSNCTVTRCGNFVTTAGEECDDGYFVDDDGCDSNCTFTACGNDVRTTGEMCDDGNLATSDGCSDMCTPEPGQLTPGGTGKADCEFEFLPRPQPLKKKNIPAAAVICHDDDPSCDIGGDPGDKLCVFRLAFCVNVTDPRLSCTPIDIAGAKVSAPKAQDFESSHYNYITDFNHGSVEFNLAQLGATFTGRCTAPAINVGNDCIEDVDCDDTGGDGHCTKPIFEFNPPVAATNQCSDYADFVVALKEPKPGILKKASMSIKLKAFASNDPVTLKPRNSDSDGIKLVCLPQP